MSKLISCVGSALFLGAICAILPSSILAQGADPPGRVARLNYIEGTVSYQVSGDTTWVDADPNRPLTTGDNLWADVNSRGEVHIGSTAIRLSSQTGISFLTLDDRTVQIQLAQGTIEVHLRNQEAGDAFEIDTPNAALTLTEAGEYRVETDPNGTSTVVLVREGQGVVDGGGESYTLDAGQEYTITGTDQLTYNTAPAPEFDDFENWCQSRDQQENNSLSAKYVSRDVDGYYDLDQYGTWQSNPDYGQIWVPTGVAVGWAPYQVGHWVFIAPWGWTWVDSEPWGFAPFHYGRWAYVGDRWGWVPGPVVVRPVYAPALVAFVGGNGFGISVSFGDGISGVGWFPLGPRDVYVPGYQCSPRYFQTINVTNTRVVNITQVTNVYNTAVINRDTTRVDYMYSHNEVAITAVSKDTFVNARPVRAAAIRLTPDQIQNARATESTQIQPTRASYVSANAKAAKARPSVPFEQRPVVEKLPPASPVRNARTPAYANPQSNRGFSGPANSPSPSTPVNNAQPASRAGFRPFQPPNGGNTSAIPRVSNSAGGQTSNAAPSGGNAGAPPHANNSAPNRTNDTPASSATGQSSEGRPMVRFAAPTKASDGMYDVHPPLNQNHSATSNQGGAQASPPASPKQETQHSQSNSHSDSSRKKNDKNN